MEKLRKIQAELKAPKGQFNTFGKYKYRNCEDILEAVKPLLKEHGLTLVITDSIKEIGALIYVESTAKILDVETDKTISVTAQAGIDPNRKGMDIAQSFGSSSSYARKYALNGLFLIDDTKDPDTQPTVKEKAPGKGKPTISQAAQDKLKERIIEGESDIITQAEKAFTLSKDQKDELEALQIQVDAGK